MTNTPDIDIKATEQVRNQALADAAADAHFISNNGIIGVGLISLADEHTAEHGYDEYDATTYRGFYVDAARRRKAK